MHDLVGDDVGRHDRRAVAHLAEGDRSGALRSERRGREEGVVVAAAGVDQVQEPAVPPVHAAPALPREVVVGEARVGMAVDHRRVVPFVVGVAGHVARHPRLAAHDQTIAKRVVVAQVQRDDFGGTQAVVRLEDPAGPRRAQFLALAQDAVPAADRRPVLLVHRAFVAHDHPAVRVHEVRPQVAHRRPPREDAGAGEGRQDHERRRIVSRRFGVRLLRDQGQRLVGRDPRRRVHVDVLVNRSEDRDGHPAGELPGDAAAEHRDAPVELREALVRAPRQVPVAAARHEHQLVGPRQGVDESVEPAQFRRLRAARGHRYLHPAARFLSGRGGGDRRGGRRRGCDESSDSGFSHRGFSHRGGAVYRTRRMQRGFRHAVSVSMPPPAPATAPVECSGDFAADCYPEPER